MTPPPNAQSSARTVRQVLVDILGLPSDAALDEHANLFDQGLDSLGVVRFVTDVESALQIQLSTEDLRAELFEDLARLTAHIDAQVRESA